MMFKDKYIHKLYAFALAAVFAVTLAGCGGGGGGSAAAPDPGTTPAPDPAIAERAAISGAINAAEAAVGMVNDTASDATVAAADAAIAAANAAIADAANIPAEEKAANSGTVSVLETALAMAKTSRTAAMGAADAAMKAAMAATGKALSAALAGPDPATQNALDNIGAPALSSAGLAVDAAAGAGSLADADDPQLLTLTAGDAAGSLGGWSGMDFALSSGTGDAMVTNEARIYTNRDAPKSIPFTDRYTTLTEGALTTLTPANIMADAFTHSGTQTHTAANREDAVYVDGTYDGATGTYRCATDPCTSTNDGKGSPSALSSGWTFTPDKGAMVSEPDDTYLYYGWWVSKDSDGKPTVASAFAGEVGDVDGTGDTPSGADLTGSATYVGKAAGKFAMSNTLDGTGNGGHFTADATLNAKFGAVADGGGVTGTIDNFRLNDGSEDPGWSVSLNRSSAWAADGAITGPTSAATVWSINGNKAPASGTWSGTMYDELPGNPPGGDGNTIPTTVTGTFYSEFSDIGRMVGAFGANKE